MSVLSVCERDNFCVSAVECVLKLFSLIWRVKRGSLEWVPAAACNASTEFYGSNPLSWDG